MKFDFVQNIKSGLYWIGLFKVAGQIFVWANTIIIARFLDPADYGLVGMAGLITSFIVLFGDFGFGITIVQKKDLKIIHVHSLFWIAASIGITFLSAIYFASPLAGNFFNNPKLVPILQLSGIALFFNIISEFPIKLLLRELKYKQSGLVDFSSNLTASICVLIFAIKGWGAYSLVFGSIITGIIKFSLASFLSKWFPQAKFQRKGLKSFVRFGGTIVLNRILWYTYSNADYAILAKRLGEIPFGLYSFAFNFSSIPTSKLQPILQPVFFSSFSKIQDDLPQLRKQYLNIIDILFVCYAAAYCMFFWVSPEFVKILLGAKWEPMIPVLQVLLIVQPLRAISSGSPAIATVVGRPDIGVKNMLVFIVTMVPSFVFASRWGMMGVAVAWCLVYPIAFLITVVMRLSVVGIPLCSFLLKLTPGLKFIIINSLFIFTYKYLLSHFWKTQDITFLWLTMTGTIVVGVLSNFFVLWAFERRYIDIAKSLMKG